MYKLRLTLSVLLFPACVFAQDTTRLSLLFAGDIMQHDSNIAAAYNTALKQYDYAACFEYIAPIIRSADLAIGNLELTLAGAPYKGYPQFSAPDALAIELKRSGFDVLVTANNHSVDRRRKGLERTIRVLDSLRVLHTGTFRDSLERVNTYPLIIEKNGFKLSLLNYTYGTNGIPVTKPNIVNLIDTVQIKLDMAKARNQKTDAIIVFMHWGDEYQSLPNATQKKLAKLLFREGAKLVIGAHPHVLQPMEWNKEQDRLVVYSLGNFVSGQRPRYRDGGAMLWVDLQKIAADTIVTTKISQAEYELTWVQKSTEFVMRPLRYFENDTVFVKEKTARDAMSLFVKDSRALLTKHNVNVAERKIQHEVDSIVYAVRLGVFTETDSLIRHDSLLGFYGLDKVEHDPGSFTWYAGLFYELEIALQALQEIRSRPGFKNARLAKRVCCISNLPARSENNPD
ncbi:MAG: CapA family protein [Cyclobacteriaceae bacterium]|nr:CapA family protein [Cyclobacteriaceae bacterium]